MTWGVEQHRGTRKQRQRKLDEREPEKEGEGEREGSRQGKKRKPHPVDIVTEEQPKLIPGLPGSNAPVNIVVAKVPLLRVSPSIVHRHPASLASRGPAPTQISR